MWGRGNIVPLVLSWQLATTLSLATAPLVEPRYFILPWIFWRMQIIAPMQERRMLWAETAWFLSINAWTGYMFLFRGFEWPQEPGKVQRFMW